jgi:uncharacterized SAM-dependent methyltransferase
MSTANVTIHSSQFPDNVRRDLLESLRSRAINHKFHYQTYKQAQKWLALHEAHSPARTDTDCQATYDRAFAATAVRLMEVPVHLIALGCGGGQKEARLLHFLTLAHGQQIHFTPSDVSVPLVLTARQAALETPNVIHGEAVVCDLASDEDPAPVFSRPCVDGRMRLITFFGMIPNFEPSLILPRLAALAGREDWLLLSANLIPSHDDAAMHRILPGYDNPLTRDWLTTFLFDLGFTPEDGDLRFAIAQSDAGHRRIVAHFYLSKGRALTVEGETFAFKAGERIRLFFSCRYTPDQIRALLAAEKLQVRQQWIAASGEEGVFLCQKE